MTQQVTPYLLYEDGEAAVEFLEAHQDRALAEGAEIVEEPNDLPFGHRRYGCRDPQGHEWFFAQVLDER